MVSKRQTTLVSEIREQGCSQRCRHVSGHKAHQGQSWTQTQVLVPQPAPFMASPCCPPGSGEAGPRLQVVTFGPPGVRLPESRLCWSYCPFRELRAGLQQAEGGGESAASHCIPSPPVRACLSHPRRADTVKTSLKAPTGLHQAPGQ